MTSASSLVSVIIAVIGGSACAWTVLASRRNLILPAVLLQFLCAALLMDSLPGAMAVAYAIVGVCACAILAVTPLGQGSEGGAHHDAIPSGLSFRVVAVLLIAVVSVYLAGSVLRSGQDLAPGIPIGAGLLVGLGLLQVGLSEEPLRVGCGLLSILCGFEIGYTRLEPAIALHGLLFGIPLLIALVVAYLMALPDVGGEGSA